MLRQVKSATHGHAVREARMDERDPRVGATAALQDAEQRRRPGWTRRAWQRLAFLRWRYRRGRLTERP
jgi:hypothetical protein